MEAFYASVSGVVTAFGGLTLFILILRKDIQKVATDLKGDILRLEDRVIRLEDRVIGMDDRLREVEGDMKVVKYHLQITEAPPADPEPTQTRPARDETGQRVSPGAPDPSQM